MIKNELFYRTLVSDDPTGGWKKPTNHTLLQGWTCASEHPTFEGVTYMFYIVQEEIQGIWGASVMSDPKKIVWMPDGTVQIQEYVPDNVGRRTLFLSRADSYDAWVPHGGNWRRDKEVLTAPSRDRDAYLMNTLWGEDLAIEAEMFSAFRETGSLIVRGNPSAFAGYRISLDFERGVVGL